MIDVIGAALVERMSQVFSEPVIYIEESDTVKVGGPEKPSAQYSLHSFREMVRDGTPVEEVLRIIRRVHDEAMAQIVHPHFNLDQAIPHLLPTLQAKDYALVGNRIGPELSVVLAFDNPESILMPRYTALAEAGVDFVEAGKRAAENIKRVLEKNPGTAFLDDWPDMLAFQGDLGADRAYAYALMLPACVALFSDRDFAIVSPTTDENRIVFLGSCGLDFAKEFPNYTHPLSTAPHIFEDGRVVGLAVAIKEDEDSEAE